MFSVTSASLYFGNWRSIQNINQPTNLFADSKANNKMTMNNSNHKSQLDAKRGVPKIQREKSKYNIPKLLNLVRSYIYAASHVIGLLNSLGYLNIQK